MSQRDLFAWDQLGAVDVAVHATDGVGSSGDPWTGWDTAITWAAGTRYILRPGRYSYTDSPDWALEGIEVIGYGDVRLSHTGTGNAIALVSGSDIRNVHLANFEIRGNANTTNGLFLDGIHKSHFDNLRVNNVSAAGIRADFAVCDTFLNPRVAQEFNHGDAWTVVPVNGILFADTGGFSNTIINPYITTVSGTGIKITVGEMNQFHGGAAEQCGTGLEIASLQWRNSFYGIDLESNTDDALVYGYRNNFYGIKSNGTFTIKAALGNENLMVGGTYQDIVIEAGPADNRFVSVNYAGTVTDSGTRTRWLECSDLVNDRIQNTLSASAMPRLAVTYGASVAIDASAANVFDITVTDGTAFAIQNPTNALEGQMFTVTVRNTSGGAVGTITWGSDYKLAAWTSPATGYSRSITFQRWPDNCLEISRTPADVPN